MPIEHSTNFIKHKGKNENTHKYILETFMVEKRPFTGVLRKYYAKNFAEFTGKYLYQYLFSN